MQTMINLLVRFSGAGWIWDKVDGYKTYGVAATTILVALLGLGNEFAPAIASHNAGAIVALLEQLPKDTSWLSLMAGFGLIGLGHKVDKATANPIPPLG